MAATAEREPVRVKPSKRQTRKKRRQRSAERAAKLAESADYLMLKTCGWDIRAREMRRREPPTRSLNSFGVGRLNKSNAWHQAGDTKKLVNPEESAAWSWWMSLTIDEQDEVAEVSTKCTGRSDGGTDAMPDPMEMLLELRDTPKRSDEARLAFTLEGEDVRAWGRK